MTGESASTSSRPRLRLGMIGGGPGAFIGGVHRMAARLDDHFVLVAGALASDPARAIAGAAALGIAPDRAYGHFQQLIAEEAGRPDRVDVVAIVTPNCAHYEPAKALLEAGFHVICEKPVTTSLATALELADTVARTGRIFGLTHNYTGYPMVRQARELCAREDLGEIRVVQVEYAQDWLATPLERTGHKQAQWRTDPARSGPAGCLGDIGTHAYNLVAFVTGLECQEVAADLSILVPGRQLDDNVAVMLRFSNGARGMLWASQVAPGNENNLQLRVFGSRGALEWRQEDPNYLTFTPLGEPPRLIRRNGAGSSSAASHASRIPAGHPEGYLEAFAQLYSDLAEQILAREQGRAPDPASLLVPGIDAGVEAMRFVDGVLRSSSRNSAWVSLAKSGGA
jgi:predicted dehydrogenase